MITLKTKPSLWLGSFSLRRLLPVVGVTLIGCAVRIVRLDFQPLWWDEGWSLFFASRDLQTMLERTALDIHPPLYYILLKLWMALAGKDATTVRLFSVFVGVATIPVLYALARRLLGARVAFLSALLFALAPLQVYYSQEVRMYGLVSLLALVSVYLFVVLIDQLEHLRDLRGLKDLEGLRPPNRQAPNTLASHKRVRSLLPWAAYIVVSTAALYTHYFAAFILAFQVIAVLVVFLRLRRSVSPSIALDGLRSWIVAWLAVLVLYLPWILFAGPRLYAYVSMKVAHEAYPPIDLIPYLSQHLAAFSVGHITVWTWLYFFAAAFVILAIVGLARLQTHSDTATTKLTPKLVLLLYGGVPLAFGYVVNLVYPFDPDHVQRLLLLAAPAFSILVAMGVQVLWQRNTTLGALVLLLCSVISALSLYDFYAIARYPVDDYRPVITSIEQLAQPGDVLLAVHPWQIGYLEAYYDGPPLTVVETPSDEWTSNPASLQHGLDILIGERGRVWLPAFQTLGRILEDAVDAYLRPRTFTALDTWFGTTRLELFAHAQEPPTTSRPVLFGDSLVLSDWGVASNPVRSGQDILPVRLRWAQAAPSGYSASLRLVDAQGNTWAQDDRGIEGGEQRVGFVVPVGTPPGEYNLTLLTYRSSQVVAQAGIVLSKVQVDVPSQSTIAGLPYRISKDVGDGIALVGVDVGDKSFRPGDVIGLSLFWRPQRAVSIDYEVSIQITDDRGNQYASSKGTPAKGMYPTTHWSPGQIVRDPQSIVLRGDAPDGELNLVVSLVDPSGRVAGTERLSSVVPVKGRTHYFGAPAPSKASSGVFGQVAKLVGFDIDQDGDNLHIVLYWQSIAQTERSFKVFVHVRDSSGKTIAQRDLIPGAGAFPTTSWVKGEYLVDEYNIPVGSQSFTEIAVGLYDPVTFERLPTLDAAGQPIGDHIVLPATIR